MSKRLTVILVTFVVALAAAGADDLDEARKKSETGEWEAAEKLYRAALAAKEDRAVAGELAVVLYNRALILGRQEQFAPTVPMLQEAIDLQPSLLDARVALVLTYDKLGKKKEAAAELAAIGQLYMAAGNAAKAQEAFVESRKRHARPETWVMEGDALAGAKDYHGALEAYRKVQAAEWKGPGLRRRMGDAYMGLGLVEAALGEYESALTLDPSPETAIFLAKLHGSRGEWDRVIERLDVAQQRGAKRDADVAFLLGNAHYLKGVALADQKKTAEADAELALAVSIAGEGLATTPRTELHQIRGLALFLQKKMPDAARELEKAVELAHGQVNPRVYQALAVAYEQMGQKDKAAAAAAKVR